MAVHTNTMEVENQEAIGLPFSVCVLGAHSQCNSELEDRVIAAFRELRLPVFRYMLCLKVDPLDADEIVQESFLRLFQHLRSGERVSNLRSFVFSIAHNLAMSHFRASTHDVSSDQAEWNRLSSTLVEPALNPEEALLEKERMARLHAAVQELSPRQQYCLYLRSEGLRYREIAEILNVTVPTAAEYLRRAVAKLAKELPWTK